MIENIISAGYGLYIVVVSDISLAALERTFGELIRAGFNIVFVS